MNNDRDTASLTERQAEDSELTEVIVRPTRTPLPPECELTLVVTRDEAALISVYRPVNGGLELLLGVDPTDASAEPQSVSAPLGAEGVRCFLEAHEYPGPSSRACSRSSCSSVSVAGRWATTAHLFASPPGS